MQTSVHPLKCLMPVLALLALASCHRDDGQLGLLQDEIRTLGDQQTQTQGELNRLKTQLNSLSNERDALKSEKTRLEADLESARKTLDQMQKDFASYRSQYKLSMKTRAPGLTLGDFLVDGKSYRNVKVLEATDALLSVIHDAGAQKFAWAAVPDSIRRLFGFEKPGEYVMISFAGGATTSPVLSLEESITRHDAGMVALQLKISALQSELTILGRAEQDTRKALSDAVYKKLETVKLEGARNAYSVQRIQLEAELRSLQKSQETLIRQDPRKRRK